MITLYINPECPFCKNTVREAVGLGVPLTLKDVREPGVSEELIQLGGKKQMPYMVDDEHGVSMYESDDIIAYLHRTYG
jgi:glutathione S-transferase